MLYSLLPVDVVATTRQLKLNTSKQMALTYLKQVDSLWQLQDCNMNWLYNCFIPDTQVILEDVTNEEILTINNFIFLLGITCGGSSCMHVGAMGYKILFCSH